MSKSMRYVGLAALALASPVLAGEAAAAGNAVRRDMADARGNRFAVTVTPPAGHAVDRRFFDAIEVSADDSETSLASNEAAAEADGEPVDVSDYVVEIEALDLAATCTSKVTLKTKLVNLSGKKTFSVTSPSPPIFMAVTAFPRSNNVDTYVLNGSTPCNSSTKPKEQLDNASCVSSSCTGTSILIGQVKNPDNSTAKYVAAINMVFSN